MSKYDPLDIRAQERSDAERKHRDRVEQQSEEADLKWLMSSKRGRRVVWRLLDQAGVFRLSFSTNAMTMSFSEGNRNYGLKILGMIHSICPELYPTMIKEARNNDRHDDERRPDQ